jgi:hypothetical protein
VGGGGWIADLIARKIVLTKELFVVRTVLVVVGIYLVVLVVVEEVDVLVVVEEVDVLVVVEKVVDSFIVCVEEGADVAVVFKQISDIVSSYI